MQPEKGGKSGTQYLQRIETAACSCSVDVLIDIAKALDIPLYKLFEFKN